MGLSGGGLNVAQHDHGYLLDRYAVSQHRKGLREGTISQRARFMRRILAAFDVFSVTAGDLELWLDALDLAVRSRASYVATLASFFGFMVSEGLRGDDPADKLVRPRVPKAIPRPAANADFDRALAAADQRMRCWLLLAAYQGFRCWEIAGLRREAVLDGQEPNLLLIEDGKGGKPAVMPLNPLVLAALRDYGMPAHGHIFRYKGGRERMTPNAVSSYVCRFMQKHRIPSTAHNFRHWFGTTVYARTKDLRVTQELMRHEDPRTTAGYVAWSPSVAANVVLLLGDDG